MSMGWWSERTNGVRKACGLIMGVWNDRLLVSELLRIILVRLR